MNTTRNTLSLAALFAFSLAACTQSPDSPADDAGTGPLPDAAAPDSSTPTDAALTDDTSSTSDAPVAPDAEFTPDATDPRDTATDPDAGSDLDAAVDTDAGDPPADDAGSDDVTVVPDPRPTCQGDDHQVDGDGAESRYPRVAFTGSEYGIVFQDDRDGANPGDNWELYFARVTVGGDVLGLTRVTDDPAADTHPAMVWDGARFWITWVRTSADGSNQAVMAATAVPQGAGGLSVSAPVVVSENGTGVDRPNVQVIPAAAGGGVGVVWQDARDGESNWEVYYARLGWMDGVGGDAGGGAVDAGGGMRAGERRMRARARAWARARWWLGGVCG